MDTCVSVLVAVFALILFAAAVSVWTWLLLDAHKDTKDDGDDTRD